MRESESRWQPQVQLARGHWRREDGPIRSAGWWESVTVTWSPAPAPERGGPLRRVLATAADALAPAVADLVAASGRRWLERRPRGSLPVARKALPAVRRALPAARRALPRPARDQ